MKRIKSELKSEVWDIEYSELKKRLSTHDIHTATQRQKYSTVQSLKQLSSLNSNDHSDGDEDVREMATFLLQEYFDQPTLSKVDSMSTTKRQRSEQSNKATSVSVPHTIKEVITPIDVDMENAVFEFDSNEEDEVKSNESNNNSKRHNNNSNNKHKYKKRSSNNNNQQTNEECLSETAVPTELSQKLSSQKQRISPGKSHRYSPRPLENNKVLDYALTTSTSTKKKKLSKSHRIEIRNKFRRGVRKAMLVNAWCHISSPKQQKTLSLEQMMSSDREERAAKSKKSPSYSSPFRSFMSDNLMNALSKVGTWEFDPFEFFECPEVGGKGLVYSVWYLFDQHDIFKLFPSISPKKFMRFLTFVEEGYLDNPYHNKIHATDVVSNVAFYLNSTSFFEKHVSLFDKFTAILSAAVHDLGHDGNNNAYHITTMSDLAVTYNDISVLENYHIAQTFKIIKKPECNWYVQ